MTPPDPAPWRAARPATAITRAALALTLTCGGASALAQAHAAPEHTSTGSTNGSSGGSGNDTGIALVGSAFGTLGWAQSNRTWGYQRFIDRHGGIERDSLLGAQLDAQFSPVWSATLQARLAPSDRADNDWNLRTSWAFVAWRPGNDWLLRAGKLRVPFFLRSEHLDVGATYDLARLSAEVYLLAPTNDFTGAHVSHSWDLGPGELSLDAYRGNARIHKRDWVRDGLPPLVEPGVVFQPMKLTAQGLVATWSAGHDKARLGLHRTRTRAADGSRILVQPVWADLGPGIGYWQTLAALPGPGVETVESFTNDIYTLGGTFGLGQGWQVAGEALRIVQRDIRMGLEAWSGTLSAAREWGRFTPYLSYATTHSTNPSQGWTGALDTTSVPAAVPGSATLNASMRTAADMTLNFRQHTWALGSTYALTPRQKLKAEWAHTRASHSNLFDLPSGATLVQPRSVEVLSLSYSFVY